MSKFETNSNIEMIQIQNRLYIGIYGFDIVSDFVFRYSDLFSLLLHENRLKLN